MRYPRSLVWLTKPLAWQPRRSGGEGQPLPCSQPGREADPAGGAVEEGACLARAYAAGSSQGR